MIRGNRPRFVDIPNGIGCSVGIIAETRDQPGRLERVAAEIVEKVALDGKRFAICLERDGKGSRKFGFHRGAGRYKSAVVRAPRH